jgi:hypothetical protein
MFQVPALSLRVVFSIMGKTVSQIGLESSNKLYARNALAGLPNANVIYKMQIMFINLQGDKNGE